MAMKRESGLYLRTLLIAVGEYMYQTDASQSHLVPGGAFWKKASYFAREGVS